MTEKRPASRRGTSNGNAAGSSEDRRRRRAWLLKTYQADRDVLSPVGGTGIGWDRNSVLACDLGTGTPACRCYRCGVLMVLEELTVDRIIPGCQGGTYRRSNIRPCCGDCNEKTGGATRAKSR